MNFPTLYKKASTGKIQQWKVSVRDDVNAFGGAGQAHIESLYGQVGGKMQLAVELVSEGKNLGKANATTYFEQACAQAKGEWDKKKKKGYVETIEAAMAEQVDADVIAGGIEPMLAHKYHEQGHKIAFPAYVQPKLDGHRCIAIVKDGTCTLWSRTRKPILSSPHIIRELELRYPTQSLVLDGELYSHSYRKNFDKLSSRIRQSKPVAGHEEIEYWIYDLISDETFADRSSRLFKEWGRRLNEIWVAPEPLNLLITVEVNDEAEMMEKFLEFVEAGFEGLIIRNAGGRYVNKRSYDLQKVKEFDDAEFEIVDVVPGVGKMSDKGIFVCKTEAGDVFSCKMVGNMDKLKEYLVHKERYVGKWLTVKYQGISKKNSVPRFPVAMRLREDA